MTFNRLKALLLLSECNGDHIWSIEHCRGRGVPEAWIHERSDRFESGFDSDRHTIYLGDRVVNQYEGVRDLDLAIKLGEYLGVNTEQLQSRAASRQHLVLAIREAVEEG